MAKENPYAVPLGLPKGSLPSYIASLDVGAEEKYTVRVCCSYWSGLALYTLDGLPLVIIVDWQCSQLDHVAAFRDASPDFS